MNPDNFLVRPQREYVDAFSGLDAWLSLTQETHAQVVDHLAGLPTAFRDADASEEAKRFDLLALRLQLAVLGGDPGFARLRDQVQEIASALQDQYTIPAVRAQQTLIDELAGNEWWQDVTLPMLETMRRRLRGLVRLIERTRRNIVYTDFEDELGELTVAQLQGTAIGSDLTRFEQKLKIYLRAHENHLAIQKIRRNRQITASDLSELERIFLDAGIGTEADLDRTRDTAGGLGVFLRSLTGLDREAAREAFEDFQHGRAFSSAQLRYVNLLIDYIAHNGVADIAVLYDPPFSAFAPHGPEDLFNEAEIDGIEQVITSIRTTAVAKEEVA
jgi:type I restriction enzyme R subunit